MEAEILFFMEGCPRKMYILECTTKFHVSRFDFVSGLASIQETTAAGWPKSTFF